MWLASDRNNDKQVEEMRTSNVEWAEKVRTRVIDRRDDWQALTLRLRKKLKYQLLAGNLYTITCIVRV